MQYPRRCLPGVVALLLTTGCGGESGSTVTPVDVPDTAAPVIASVSAGAPADFTGGTIPLSVVATDGVDVTQAKAVISAPNGSLSTVHLVRGASGWSGTFPVDANIRSDGASVTYAVLVTAQDAAGNTSPATTVSVEVPAPLAPPGTPGF